VSTVQPSLFFEFGFRSRLRSSHLPGVAKLSLNSEDYCSQVASSRVCRSCVACCHVCPPPVCRFSRQMLMVQIDGRSLLKRRTYCSFSVLTVPLTIDVKNVFFYVFYFGHVFLRFLTFFLIFQTFLFLKNVGKVQSSKQINKNYFQNNRNEIDLMFFLLHVE